MNLVEPSKYTHSIQISPLMDYSPDLYGLTNNFKTITYRQVLNRLLKVVGINNN
jgi:hypothetical protein